MHHQRRSPTGAPRLLSGQVRLVQCLPTCLTPGEQPADPIPAGEWIANKVAATT